MDTHIDARAKRAWTFFTGNMAPLVLGTLIVVLGFAFLVPGPWLLINLLGEIADAAHDNREVRWRVTYERTSTFLPAWGLTLAAGSAIAFGTALCVLPGVLLAAAWFHAPVLVARGVPVFDAMGTSYHQLHSVDDWVATVLNGLVLVACVVAMGFTAILTVVALPLALSYLAYSTLDSGLPWGMEKTATADVAA